MSIGPKQRLPAEMVSRLGRGWQQKGALPKPVRAVPLPNIDESTLPPEKEAILLGAIKLAFAQGRLGCEDWRPIVDAELRKRLYWFKYRYTPWMNSIMPLDGVSILEIGAGTGCATIPLLEAGARVTSIDMSEKDLKIAQLRAELHGMADGALFRCANAADIGSIFAVSKFDMIAYFASLEHMTYAERIASLRAAWSLLRPGQYLAVCDTPNRLWYFDEHTARQNFFHWLPDELAIDYAAHTARENFNVDFAEQDGDAIIRLCRWGRGVSYHDFEIALGVDIRGLPIHGEWQYRRETDNPQWWADTWMNSKDGQFHRFLQLAAPDLPLAFTEPELAFMLRKP